MGTFGYIWVLLGILGYFLTAVTVISPGFGSSVPRLMCLRGAPLSQSSCSCTCGQMGKTQEDTRKKKFVCKLFCEDFDTGYASFKMARSLNPSFAKTSTIGTLNSPFSCLKRPGVRSRKIAQQSVSAKQLSQKKGSTQCFADRVVKCFRYCRYICENI